MRHLIADCSFTRPMGENGNVEITRDLTINALATVAGLPPSSIKNILYGKSKNPKIATIKIICDGVNMSLKEFFDSAEFDNLDQEIE